jgi:hypothetical protein
MSADTASPAEPGVGVNRYAYMLNDPIGGTDPSGHNVMPKELANLSDAQREQMFASLDAAGSPVNQMQARLSVGPPRPETAQMSAAPPFSFWRELNKICVSCSMIRNAPVLGSLISLNEANKEIARAERLGLPADYRAREDAFVSLLGEAGASLPFYFMPKAPAGGRLGSATTREHVAEVAGELESRGWTITHGGGRGPEEYLPGPGGARTGASYPDITATRNGTTLRVNTVDTLADGLTMTQREKANAARIRAQTGEHLLTVPKPK